MRKLNVILTPLIPMLQSGDTQNTTAADHTLGQASIKLPDLLRMIFDPKPLVSG